MDLICGMHRSGTSLIARMASLAGGDFGDPAGFHPPDRWNIDGYFEQQEILAVNMALVHGPWWKFAYFSLPSVKTVLRRAARQRDRIIRLNEKYRDKIVKDNRFCITLPGWQKYEARIRRVLVVFREPHDVARSLKARNRIPIALAYRIWCRHYRSLLAAAASIDKTFIWYDRLLKPATAEGEAATLLAALGLARNQAGPLVARTVRSPGLGDPPLSHRYPAKVSELYQYLKDASRRTSAASGSQT